MHQVTSFTVESVIRRSQTVLHKEHLSVTDVILCMSFLMIKDLVFRNSPFVTANNMTQHSISVLSVKMVLESPLIRNVSLNTAPNITSKLMSVNNVLMKPSMGSIIITLWEIKDVTQFQSVSVLFLWMKVPVKYVKMDISLKMGFVKHQTVKYLRTTYNNAVLV